MIRHVTFVVYIYYYHNIKHVFVKRRLFYYYKQPKKPIIIENYHKKYSLCNKTDKSDYNLR